MDYRKLAFAGLAAIPLAFGVATLAKADKHSNEVNETQAVMNAKISLADAIKVAETEAKGKAVDSGVADENGVVSYDVEIVGQNGKRTDVLVDPQTGKVLKMAAAEADDESGKEGDEKGETEGNEAGETNAN